MDNSPDLCQATDDMIPSVDTSNNVSSYVHTCFSSIPKGRGFKMAFLNIVSLPKKMDEIRSGPSRG